MTESICCFYWSCHMKKQHYSSLQSWYIADSILAITFGMPICDCPHLYEWIQSSICIYICLKNCKKINFIPQFILEIELTCCLQLPWAYLTTPTWNGWIDLQLPPMTSHIQKTKFITQLILEIKLLLVAITLGMTRPDHAQLKWLIKLVAPMDV